MALRRREGITHLKGSKPSKITIAALGRRGGPERRTGYKELMGKLQAYPNSPPMAPWLSNAVEESGNKRSSLWMDQGESQASRDRITERACGCKGRGMDLGEDGSASANCPWPTKTEDWHRDI